jgi:hypothetical protein
VFPVGTDNDAVDLQPFANLLATTYHSGEIQNLRVLVTNNAGVTSLCSNPDAEACYIPDDPINLTTGLMVLSYEDTDLPHTVFHEYGHHIDNQLYNLAGAYGCDFDGSRRWYFARDEADNLFSLTTCDPSYDWSQQLAEVYAEDYAQLASEVAGYPISPFDERMAVPPPDENVLAALQTDIDSPFVPFARNYSGRFRGGKAFRSLYLDAPSFLDIGSSRGVRRTTASGCDSAYAAVFEGSCSLRFTARRHWRRFRAGIDAY